MSIRKYTVNDYPAVLEIYSKAKLDELRYENNIFELLPLDKDNVRLAGLIESEIYLYDNGRVLGYGAICDKEIRALFVLPESRGLGVGKVLLEFLISQISGVVSLYVADSNFPAKNLYGHYGFKVTDIFETSYNGISVLANRMVRAISNE